MMNSQEKTLRGFGILDLVWLVAVNVFLMLIAQTAAAENSSPEELSRRLYRSLTGVSLVDNNPMYGSIVAAVTAKDYAGAARIITGGRTAGVFSGAREFYDVTLLSFGSSFNRDENLRSTPNELAAMIIGNTLDDAPITDLLTENMLYSDTNVANAGNVAFDRANDTHFINLANGAAGFTSPTFTRRVRSAVASNGEATAPITGVGMFTTRTWGLNYYDAGTLRRPWVGILNHLYCVSIDGVKNTNVPDLYVRRDISRAPSGDESVFTNDCRGCHGVMDAAMLAFAYMDYNNAGANGFTSSVPGVVPVRANGNFPVGAPIAAPFAPLVQNDNWAMVANEAQNRIFGFPEVPFSGSGLRAFGQAIGGSDGFYNCMAKRVVSQIYLKKAFSVVALTETDKRRLQNEEPRIKDFAAKLKVHKNLKRTFEEVAVEYLKLTNF